MFRGTPCNWGFPQLKDMINISSNIYENKELYLPGFNLLLQH